MNESGTAEAECPRKVKSGRKVAGAIRSLVNARNLQLECPRVFDETLLAPVRMYGSETTKLKEKRSRIRVVQIDNLRGFLGILRMDRIQNARIRDVCRVKKRVYERIDVDVLRSSAMWRERRNTGLLRESI